MNLRPCYPSFRVLLLCVLMLSLSVASRAQGRAALGEIPDVDKWITTQFAKGKVPPFSFVYGGKPSASFITGWKYSASRPDDSEQGVERYLYTYQDPRTGLKLECQVKGFPQFHTVEWVINLTNTGKSNTPILERFRVVDQQYAQYDAGIASLLHLWGSNSRRDDFRVFHTPLTSDTTVYMSPINGRSSDGDAFPFFNLMRADEREGIVVAIGWTGTWEAELKATDAKNVSLQSGMKHMRLYLEPGETIRTPLVCLVSWKGESLLDGQNRFRRFQLAHHSHHQDGAPARYPIASGFLLSGPLPCAEGGCLTEEVDLLWMRRMKDFGVVPEAFWLDAGWYEGSAPSDWYESVGTWTPDTVRYPRGIKPVADEAHRMGCKFLLWFEPERVGKNSWLGKNHPEWQLFAKGSEYGQLDLGNPEALEWVCTHIGDMIEEVGIDIYRQDFNHPVDVFWRQNDAPDRVGIHEIRHIEGLYKFWDYLLARFPNLLIDNCASGGRRIDLETMSRSVPLWRTDHGVHDAEMKNSNTYTLSLFLPQHATGVFSPDPYTTRAGMTSSVVFGFDVMGQSQRVSDMKAAIETVKKYREYYFEDYYPMTGLTLNTSTQNTWIAYQFHRPSDESGIVLAFRREGNPRDRIRLNLQGVDPAKTYEVRNEDTGVSEKVTGAQLRDYYYIYNIPMRGSAILHYKAVNP